MAQKRMFDKSIMETDNFLNISLTAKALYFLLGMEADDEGFISPKRVLRLYGGEIGDLKNLIDTGLVIPFKSGVIVITDWNQNNWLDNRRIRPTQYQTEKKMLILTSQKKYMLSGGLAVAKTVESSIEEKRVEQKSIASDKVAKEFIFENELKKLEESDRRDMNIIAFYFSERGFSCDNAGQFKTALRRHLRPAGQLKDFTDTQLAEAVDKVKEKYPEWTLETLIKVLTK